MLTNIQRTSSSALSFLLQLQLYELQYVDISSQISDLHTTISRLLNGQFPYEFVPATTISGMVHSLRAHLLLNNIPLTIVGEGIFHNPQFILSRLRSRIFITLKIPLSPLRDVLILYRVQTLSMPLYSSSNFTSRAINVSPYIAYSPEDSWYLEFSQTPFWTIIYIIYTPILLSYRIKHIQRVSLHFLN